MKKKAYLSAGARIMIYKPITVGKSGTVVDASVDWSFDEDRPDDDGGIGSVQHDDGSESVVYREGTSGRLYYWIHD